MLRPAPLLPVIAILLGACGDDGGGAADAEPQDSDDAGSPSADALSCSGPDLAPTDDGSGIPPSGIPDLVISEVNPGDYVELFNTTHEEIDLAKAPYSVWQICSRPTYLRLPRVRVPAKGYAIMGWSGFPGTTDEAGGEVALWASGSFSRSEDILDFVCWGAGNAMDRKGQAEDVGKWSGACAPALPADGAIHRSSVTTGTSAGDYDTSAAPSRLDCSAE